MGVSRPDGVPAPTHLIEAMKQRHAALDTASKAFPKIEEQIQREVAAGGAIRRDWPMKIARRLPRRLGGGMN